MLIFNTVIKGSVVSAQKDTDTISIRFTNGLFVVCYFNRNHDTATIEKSISVLRDGKRLGSMATSGGDLTTVDCPIGHLTMSDSIDQLSFFYEDRQVLLTNMDARIIYKAGTDSIAF